MKIKNIGVVQGCLGCGGTSGAADFESDQRRAVARNIGRETQRALRVFKGQPALRRAAANLSQGLGAEATQSGAHLRRNILGVRRRTA
jgi:hypothetical protein